ncbi:hypothetical protein [Fulvivirga lutimaris]|uniref:hypothetical protein n=1 Tax=Fulvivirga lutimaris TaxID=1819566 RepID=UPI0012BCC5DB|nr:hypothetical protein [Fulvivirga lutimaris]MTI39212.1 hypothetical protein [Fulvivirga lutimaris]
MKKFLIIVLSVAAILALIFVIVDEPIPEGKEGPEAEQLADNILKSINKQAWDSLEVIEWTYPIGDHHYTWNKKEGVVEVSWDNIKVVIQPDDGTGEAFVGGELIDDDDLINNAINYFNNDSFWLIAPYKIKDPGTIRKVVDYEGSEALLVQFTSGGSTPGDSYLWIVDDNYRPVAWKFWASIIPIGGMYFTWEGWKDINGAQISTVHEGLMTIEISGLK